MPDAELRDLRDVQFAQVESGLLRDPRIPYGHKALYSLLITYGPSRIFPGQGTLAGCLGVKRETVNRWLKEMKRCRLITWQYREGTSNLYAILGYDQYLRKVGVILESHLGTTCDPTITPLCAEDHTWCDPTVTRSRSNELDQLNEIWIIVLAELALVVGKGTYSRYYTHTRLASLNNTHAEVQCGDVEWFDTQGRAMVERQLSAVAGRDVSVVFV